MLLAETKRYVFIQFSQVLKQALVLTAAVARIIDISNGFHILLPSQLAHALDELVERSPFPSIII